MKKIPTVTVAISAYNEQKNIVNFLKSVLMQEEKGFVLKQIWVHSDGSTDKTVKFAKSLKSSRIKVWDHKKRVGKSTWLNKIYEDLDTDFLVQSDADVVFTHPLVIHDLIQPLVRNSKVGMVGGNPMPLPGDSYWEKVVANAFEPYQVFRSTIRGGDNAFSAIGQLLVYRKELVKQITVPYDMVTNDIYTYFCCLTLGFKYKYAKNAIVYFRSPQRLNEVLKQNTRFQTGYIRMFDYFSKEMVEGEMSIPLQTRLLALSAQLIKHPILSSTFYLIKIYSKYQATKKGRGLNAKWPIALTTKKLTT